MFCNTVTVTIYVGLREGYNGIQHKAEEAIEVCQEYVDKVGLCVTVTPTTYVYKKGKEEGVAIGLMNYPRFPSSIHEIKLHAFELANLLREKFKQHRASIVTPFDTYMIGDKD